MTQYKDKSEHRDAAELNARAFGNGCTLYESGDFQAARTSFESALEYQPEDPRAWFALGNCHNQLQQASKAEVCYLMCLKFSAPEARTEVYYNLGNSLFDQAKYTQAIECYSQIGEQSKAYAAAQKNMALARRKLD